MADLDLNELERLEKAATPGPWKWDSDQIKGDPMNRCRYRVCVVGKTVMQTYYSSDDVHAETDAALTCAIRNALPELLRRLRAAEARIAELDAEVRAHEAILALREADPAPVHPSAKPFKCPHCYSRFFGSEWRGKEVVGRYCNGWPSGYDRSYEPCPAKYVEWYEQADQRGAAARTGENPIVDTADRLSNAGSQSAPHHPGGQPYQSPHGLWIVWFEDAEVRPEVFYGHGAEEAAKAFYKQKISSWSCHLLCRVPDPGRQETNGHPPGSLPLPPASPGLVSVPREELEWIARQYDDGQPSYELASRLYDVSCTARAMLAAAEEERSRG